MSVHRRPEEGVRAIVDALRVVECGPRRVGSRWTARCPAHGDQTPSLSVAVGREGPVLHCFAGCDPTAVLAVLGLRWPDVLGRTPLRGLATRRASTRPPPPSRVPAAALAATWAGAMGVTDDPVVAGWLRGRGLDPATVHAEALARALPAAGPSPTWATGPEGPWHESGHRLLLQMFDSAGRLASLRARRVVVVENDPHKAMAPMGGSLAGTALACPLGHAMLVGSARPARVVVVEGEPDFLTWAVRTASAEPDRYAVLGLVAGSWDRSIADRIPTDATVCLRLHHDDAGARYRRSVLSTLSGRVKVVELERSVR